MSKKYEVDMTNGGILGKMIVFTIPIVLTGLLQLLYNAADIAVVGRFINIMGTEGSISASFDEKQIPVHIHNGWKDELIDVFDPAEKTDHGGGDAGIIHALYEIMTGTYTGKSICTITQSNENHKIVFAAEKARLTNTVVEL